MHHQGLSYVPEIIWTELTSRHHDEGTSASRKLEDSLPGKSTRPAVAIYQLEGHQSRFGCNYLCLPIGRTRATIRSLSTSAYRMSRCKEVDAPEQPEIISDIVIRYHNLPDSATETQSSPLSFDSFGTTSKFDCDYHLRVIYENLN